MRASSARRRVLFALFVVVGLAVLRGPSPTEAQAPAAPASAPATTARGATLEARGLTPADFPRPVKLTEAVYAWEDVGPGGTTTNSLIVLTADSVVVIDALGSREQTQRLLEGVALLTPLPVRRVIVASPATDRLAGLAVLPRETRITAAASAEAAIRSARGGDAGASPDAMHLVTLAVGDVTELTVGGLRFEITRLGRGRTGTGDLAVSIPEKRVLYLGDLFEHAIFPAPPAAYPTEWIEAVRKAEGMAPSRWVVPGRGFVDDPPTLRTALTDFRRAMERARAEGSRLYRAGVPIAQAATRADFGEFAAWPLRADAAQGYLRRVYEALSGDLRARVGEEFK